MGGEVYHRIRNVLRMRPGDVIVVLDNSGWEYEAEIVKIGSGIVEGRIRGKRICPAEPHVRVRIFQALLKGEKFDFVLQKGTEIGVSEFIPFLSERCVARNPGREKLRRWRQILKEAAEQCGRGKIPALSEPLSFEQACRKAESPCFFLWEGEREKHILNALRELKASSSLDLFIGPEGGFSSREAEMALRSGFLPVSLGRRVLRSETAAIVAAALALYILEGRGV